MSQITFFLPPIVTTLVMLALTGRVVAYLKARRFLDHPNERSSHNAPTPRGGGLAVTTAVVLGWLCALPSAPSSLLPTIAVTALGAVVLMLIGWWDDRHSLPPAPRFLLQMAAIAAALMVLPPGLTFQGMFPPWLDVGLTFLGWLWFVNLYNFMDGIDGITGVETTSVGVGIAVLASATVMPLALSVALAGLLFLKWNWHPAKVFLGDVGSIPLGHFLAALLVILARDGQVLAAVILPAYYLADATITLVRRALRGEKIWRPHRLHFYQRAVQAGRSHAVVSSTVLVANMVLIGAAALTAKYSPLGGIALAACCVGGLLCLFRFWAIKETP